MKNLDAQQIVTVENLLHPEKNTYRSGPMLCKLEDAWEVISFPRRCTILDQNDYLIVRSPDGVKSVLQGPLVYKPSAYGEEIVEQAQSIDVPINHYMIVNDADSKANPVIHIRGPLKWYPLAFQTPVTNPETGKQFWQCWEITAQKAVHLQRANGAVDILEIPTYYMPQVGEQMIRTVLKQVLVPNDFCILKSPDGSVSVKNGQNPADRSFFPKPFETFLTFKCETNKSVVSTLPTFMPHNFVVRTNDNVMLDLDMRISYKFEDVNRFSDNPIDFYSYIKFHVQNNLLDKFAQSSLRDFMNAFSKIAESTIVPTNEYFRNFGISIEDLQILNYNCQNKRTQELLSLDIHTNVTKQNELRARQNDILIREQANEVTRKQKDLEVQMCLKDNEVALQQKLLENKIRVAEMDIEIQEEMKRTDLLEVRRGNDLTEAEFEGRARGHALREFLSGIDPKLSSKEKIEVYTKQVNLDKAKSLYTKANKMTVYPNAVDMKTFQMPSAEAAESMKASYMNGIGFTHGQQSQNE